MTRSDFIAAAKAELVLTHPEIDPAIAQVLIGQSHDFLLDAFDADELNEPDLMAAEELTVWRYARIGSEGVSTEAMSGVSQSFSDDLPKPLRRMIARRRKVRWR